MARHGGTEDGGCLGADASLGGHHHPASREEEAGAEEFPWEKPKKPKAEVVSREEARKRFERLMGNRENKAK